MFLFLCVWIVFYDVPPKNMGSLDTSGLFIPLHHGKGVGLTFREAVASYFPPSKEEPQRKAATSSGIFRRHLAGRRHLLWNGRNHLLGIGHLGNKLLMRLPRCHGTMATWKISLGPFPGGNVGERVAFATNLALNASKLGQKMRQLPPPPSTPQKVT